MALLHPNMVTSAFDLPGYTVVESLGIVRGISVRSLNMVSGIFAGIRSLLGGNIRSYTKLCETTRQEAFEVLMQHAHEMGANAIIGLRYDANEIHPGITEVLAYGTAVIAEKK